MSPRAAKDTEALRSRQQERILGAAAKEFARRGFSSTKVSDIAASAGVSHGLVHHYFGSKAEVFVAIVRRTMANADALPKALLSMEGTHRERLRWFAQTVLEGVKAMPEVFFLSVEASANASVPPEARRLVTEQGPLAIRALGRFIAEGQQAGEFRAGDPDSLAAHLLALVQGLALQRLGADDTPINPDADILVGLLARKETP